MSEKFLIGAATAAHQVEGNNIHSDYWKIEHLEHSDFTEPSGAAVDHYHCYEEDIRLLSKAGLNAYRFSIEWARIEPQEGFFDKEEVQHYRKVLDCCLKNQVTPIVTLHHFSSPAWLISKGGWGNVYVIEAFRKYVHFIMKELGEKIHFVCTINEANMGFQLHRIIEDMRSQKAKAGAVQIGTNEQMDMESIMKGMMEQGEAFLCPPSEIHTFLKPRAKEQEEIVMRCHQAAVKEIKNVSPKTKVGLTLSLFDYQPTEDGKETDEKLWYEDFGFYLPYFKEDDFLGVQNYTRKKVDKNGSCEETDFPLTQMGYEIYPAAIGNVLRRVARDFHGDLIVTENGIAVSDDQYRQDFIKEALNGVMEAKKNGIPVKGYFYWSLLDNFEWQAGYGKNFGLVAVDRKTQCRYPKESLAVFGNMSKSYAQKNIE